jgi:GNAT superfamily N-acetyltransferase
MTVSSDTAATSRLVLPPGATIVCAAGTIELRVATHDLVDQMVVLINRAYLSEAHLKHGDRTNAAELHNMLDNGPGVFWVGFIDGKLACCVNVRSVSEENVYFGFLSVEDAYQGKGIGRGIVRFIADVARKAQYKRLELWALELRQELIVYYEKEGFRITGSCPFHSPQLKQKCDFVVMHKELEQRM